MPTRRNLVAGLSAGWLLASFVHSQPKPKLIGILNPYTSRDNEGGREVFVAALMALGYVRGKHYVLVERLAEGKEDRLRDLAAELVNLKVDVICANTSNATAAAQQLTSTIPIVFAGVGNPVLAGFAESVAHPGHNLTGLTNFSGDLTGKRLELLRQLLPNLVRVAMLVNPANPYYPGLMQRMRTPAEQLGLEASFVMASRPEDLPPAFQTMTQQRAEAVLVLADFFFWAQRQQLAALTLQSRLPSMFPFVEVVDLGGLMSYGPDAGEEIRRTASYVDKIFKGANPAELPIEQPTKVDLVINRKTAEALRITIPQVLLLQAERLI